jgi:putative ABC transport system permease protein
MGLWIRWSWRDLKERWLQVVAVALIIGLGTGIYAGLGGSKPWRLHSYDKSYALLHMYDLRIKLTQGSYVDAQTFLDAVHSIPHAAWIESIEPRLFLPTLVDASTPQKTVMRPGVLIGVDVENGGPQVNGIYPKTGRNLTAADAGQNVAVLNYSFAHYFHLPASGDVTVSGNTQIHYVGFGLSPEFFSVVDQNDNLMMPGSYAPLFMPLQSVQALSGHAGMANDFVLTVTPDANLDVVRTEITSAVAAALPGTSISTESRADNPAYTGFYNDINNDQRTYTVLALLFLGGAAFGAFNLAGRMVEAQRRQIGIGMALGVPRRLIAVRPLLVGAQIAILGGIFGMIFGLLLSRGFASIIHGFIPLPVWDMAFQFDVFLKAAVLGIILPFVATAYPVWRATRVIPVDAIKTGNLVEKGAGASVLASHLPIPGKSFTQMPFRNLLRSPRRSLLTLLGIGIAVATLIAMFGLFDTMSTTIDKTKKEELQSHPQRMIAYLDDFYPADSARVTAITQSSSLSMAEPGLTLEGTLIHGSEKLDVSVELLDLNSPLWKPTLKQGSRQSDGPGVLISERAAQDLGVKVGDTITLEHPSLGGQSGFQTTQTDVQVIGIHGTPMRSSVFMDINQASALNLDDLVNEIQMYPAAGVTPDSIQRTMLQQPGVAYVISVSDNIKAFESIVQQLMQMKVLLNGIVLLMVFLIAFNSTSINIDERAREIATMFAFGLRVRTVIRMAMLENLIMGALGTLVGIGLGFLMLHTVVFNSINLPELGLIISVAPKTFLLAAVFGIGVVALTPLFNMRKMLRMDIPSTLRVME